MKATCAVMLTICILSAPYCFETQAQTSNEMLTGGTGVKGQTLPVRSSAGFTVVLTVNADDDHSKNSHKCEANYTLKITGPDGSSLPPFQFLSSDDEWARPLRFRVEGFSNDGHHVFILLIEGDYPQSLQAKEFDVNSGHEVKSVFLNPPFTRGLSRDCAATLHIVGTSLTWLHCARD